MQHKKFPVIVFLLFFGISVSAQQEKPILAFSEKEFNFGTIKETDGERVHDFQFTNQGKVPLIVNNVKSSCGCTVPSWPREPVLPGKTGNIKVSFNPKNQSGAITKTVQILSNAEVPQVVLSVRGIVIPAEKVEDVFKFNVGELRLQTIYAAFGEVYKGRSAQYSIRVFNNSANQPAVLTFSKLPAHLKITVKPQTIEPLQEGVIELEYLTAELNNWDYVVDRLDLLVNGKVVPNNRINVTANIKEDFSGLSAEQLALAARAEFDSREFDFGSIAADKIVEHSFMLTNAGKSNLYIRKVTASCGCTAVQPARTTIPPGESTAIKAVFNARGREGNQKKAITVITNDPKRSRSILWINAMVEKPAGMNPSK
jgi:hypothetical protein